MKTIISNLVGAAVFALLTTGTAIAQTTPAEGALVQNTETGHYYQVFGQTITWDDAKTFVDEMLPSLGPDGMPSTGLDAVAPHLATITSSREEVFVDALRDGEIGDGALTQSQTWIGGIQDPSGAEPGGGWRWVNSEGAFPGVNGGIVYTNWAQPPEPNNSGNEDHLTLGRYGLGGGWNDELQTRSSIGGFIVEWDVPLDAGECVDPTGCTTIVGQTLVFPEGSNPNNGTISFNSFEFRDPRVDVNGVCNLGVDGLPLGGGPREPLRIFGNTGIGSAPGERPEMFIPPYLCGSPNFVIVSVDSGNLVFETGTVEVINDTSTVLPDNFYPGYGLAGPIPIFGSSCDDPIVQDFPNFGDPQYQDISVWQDTEIPTKMLEVDPGVGGVGEFEGATGEFTNRCGTSRMRVRGASYFGIGFHIDFGPGFEWATNTAMNFDQFVALTRYKLELLKQSVRNARSDGAISRFAFRYLLRPLVAHSIRMLDRGRYARAQRDIHVFLWLVENVVHYQVVSGENHNGEHLMRGSNIEFMLDVKVRPYAP